MSAQSSSLQAAHEGLKEWLNLDPKQLADKWHAESMDDRLSKFDPSTPPTAWHPFILAVAWTIMAEVAGEFNPAQKLGLSKEETASFDAMWSEPAPTSESAVDPAAVKFRQDFEMLSKEHGSIVEKTVLRCGPKVVARGAAVRTHRGGKVGGAHREDLIKLARFIDAARLEELQEDYGDMKTAFAKQATSLLETDAQSTSESRTHGDQQSLASTGTNGQSMAVTAWMERYGKDQITAQSADGTMLSILTDFMDTLEKMSAVNAESSGASIVGKGLVDPK
ncbi:hypothetical protein NCC49_005189 [Naganishia albida]|nr:hypothetical protein NCC49_005189 [Naganishia albida]